MNIKRPEKDVIEVFGYAPNDTSADCRSLWNIGACPFLSIPCTKRNHDGSVTYGTCSVSSPYGDCVICPNRLYVHNFQTLKTVSRDAFGDIPCLTYSEYVQNRQNSGPYVVLLGMHSGHEINLRNSCSMDWVLAKIENSKLVEYTGIEVQSIDITGNYRDNWYAYKNISQSTTVPKSEHGLNWANVHKRLIPQIIRKSIIYSRSKLVHSGLYFIVPEIVYKKFEDIIGKDIPLVDSKSPETITVHTYSLGKSVCEGCIRSLELIRSLRFSITEFSNRFISGPNLPNSVELDLAVCNALGISDNNNQYATL